MARSTPGMSLPAAVVRSPTARVTVAGVARDFDALSVTRELGSGLPGQVAGTDDMVAATASVDLAPLDVVTTGPSVPWRDPHRPRLGDSVNIDLGMDGEPVRTLTGRVDASHGVASDHWRSVDVVDRVDKLRRRVSLEPMVRNHPSPLDGEPMQMGLHPTWVTTHVARRCFFHATPPMRWQSSFVSATLAGSAWPERGRLVRATGTGANLGGYPVYASAPWGLVVRNINASWEPYLENTRNGVLSQPFYVHFMVHALGATGAARVTLGWRDGHRVVVRVTPTGMSVDCFSTPGGDVPDGDSRYQWDFPSPATSTGDVEVSAWLHPTGRVELRVQSKSTGTDWRSTGIVSFTPVMRAEPIRTVDMHSSGSGSDVGGLQVGQSASTFDLHDWTQNAIIETDPDGDLDALPAIIDRQCMDLLKEQARAELASMWIDEYGRFRYRSLARLLREPVARATTLDGVSDVPWSEAWGSVAESVQVSWRKPHIRQSRLFSVTVHEGQAPTLTADEPLWEEVVHPEADTDWIQVGPLRAFIDAAGDADVFNAGRGSWVAGTLNDPSSRVDDAIPARSWHFGGAGLTMLDYRSWLVTVRAGELDGRQLVLSSEESWPLRPNRRGLSTPILRARAMVTWSDQSPVVGRPFGPGDTGIYEHDCSWWVQSQARAQEIADHLARYMSAPWPTIQAMSVPVDDGRQLGDAEQLDFLDGHPPIQYVVTAIEDTYTTADGRRQQITGKITRPEEVTG